MVKKEEPVQETSQLERDIAKVAELGMQSDSPPNKVPFAQAHPPTYSTYGKVKGYEDLERILTLAYEQSAKGKGRERHSVAPVGDMPWHLQPILANARQVGPGGPAQQVMKKAGESVTMAGNKQFAAAKAEALGAIVYAAALYKLYEEMEQAHKGY